jgi:hypothetical protein
LLASSFAGLTVFIGLAVPSFAVDYFLTIAGGYARQGNQASLEANVLFLDELLASVPREPYQHSIFFADGDNPEADLQVVDKSSVDQPILEVLAEVFQWPSPQIHYRNHRIEKVLGRNHPRDVQQGLAEITGKMQAGDRLFVYVTAHGGAAISEQNRYDTSVHCWGGRQIRASQFAEWLDGVPESVPVIMVMAQCYCGGFSHVIFDKCDSTNGLSSRLRCGFFAQRHDLPAAGCRPDISNDAEYSSYFWGALAGRSRNGQPINNVDLDNDGRVSLVEAHAYAVITSETIDIPLRASEALLRASSRVGEEEEDASLVSLQSTVASLLVDATPTDRAIVLALTEALNVSLDQSVAQVVELASAPRSPVPRGRRGMRGYRGRAQALRDEMLERWPKLDEMKSVEDVSGFDIALEGVWQEIQGWETYVAFREARLARADSKEAVQQEELKQVKTRRLVHTLESMILERNLPLVADSAVLDRYQAMLRIEESTL